MATSVEISKILKYQHFFGLKVPLLHHYYTNESRCDKEIWSYLTEIMDISTKERKPKQLASASLLFSISHQPFQRIDAADTIIVCLGVFVQC